MPPSSKAQALPGAEGRFAFKPADWIEGKTTYWFDTDGVAPEVAGCHVSSDETGTPNGRFFGEACLPNGLLVESNPGPNEVHAHSNDTGSPDTFDCNDYCMGEYGKAGQCQAVESPEAPAPCEASARCACS